MAAAASAKLTNREFAAESIAQIQIRPGMESDAAALSQLAARTFYETFAADTRPADMTLHLAEAYGTPQQTRELIDPDITTLLVEIDGQLAGFAQLRAGAAPKCVTGLNALELWRFYIDAPWHGRGVAHALMRRVEREAHQRGAHTLWLGVWERNERAKAFYVRTGFVDVGSHIFIVGADAQTDRVMARLL